MNSDNITDILSEQIKKLHIELIDKDIDSFNQAYRDEVYNLQEQLLLMHRKIKDLSLENNRLSEKNQILKSENEHLELLKQESINKDAEIEKLRSDYYMVVNSRSWKITQIFRNIYWNIKGKNERI